MTIIKITPESNGAHANQSGYFPEILDGWALIPDELLSTWEQYKPFVTIETNSDGNIVSMVDNPAARAAQQEADANQPPPPPTPEERIAQLEQEKNLLQAQVQATSRMMDFYEECIVEMAMIVYG